MCLVIMTMRATQKKMMSKPVTSTDEGKYRSSAGLLVSGYCGVQSSVENGHRADENQVSRTSSSCTRGLPCASAFASVSSCATYTLPLLSYHAGMRWPHQSWREMHQSWMFSSHWL